MKKYYQKHKDKISSYYREKYRKQNSIASKIEKPVIVKAFRPRTNAVGKVSVDLGVDLLFEFLVISLLKINSLGFKHGWCSSYLAMDTEYVLTDQA